VLPSCRLQNNHCLRNCLRLPTLSNYV
jgi:hypothetical protein